jgi:hypothetical protein
MKTKRIVIRLSDDEIESLGEYGQLLVRDGHIKKNTTYAAANWVVRFVLNHLEDRPKDRCQT